MGGPKIRMGNLAAQTGIVTWSEAEYRRSQTPAAIQTTLSHGKALLKGRQPTVAEGYDGHFIF